MGAAYRARHERCSRESKAGTKDIAAGEGTKRRIHSVPLRRVRDWKLVRSRITLGTQHYKAGCGAKENMR